MNSSKKWRLARPRSIDHRLTCCVYRPQKNSPPNSPSQNHRCQPCADQLELAATSYLCTVLKRDLLCGHVFRDDQEVDAIYRLSLHQTQQILTSSHLTPIHISRRRVFHLATLYASLMNLIQWRQDVNMNEYETMVKSTLFVDNVIACLCPSPGMDESSQLETSIRSREEGNSQGALPHALDLVDCWALSGGLAWEEFLVRHEKHWRSSITDFWNHALAKERTQMIPLLPEMVLLHSRSRFSSRAVLSSVVKSTCVTSNNDILSLRQTSRIILSVLVELLQSTTQRSKLHVASLLRVLLSDRSSLSTHDDFSRALWESLDAECLEKILVCALQVSDCQGVSRPLTLAMVDLLDTLLQDTHNCDLFLTSLSTERFERLVAMVESKKIKFDFKDGTGGWDDLSLDLDSDTPTAKNLSRLDETSICVEQEDDRVAVGVDATIQLSCATMLARLGYNYSSLTEEGPHLMKARACNVVIDFLTRFYSGAGHRPKGFLSFDHNKRALRLQLAVGTSENEDFIATTLFSGQVLQQRLHWEGYHASQATQLKLKAAEDRVTELERHIKKLTAQNRSQAIVVKRELSRIKENTSHDSKQLVAIHAAERSMAENQVVECRLQLEKVDSRFQDALVQIAKSESTMTAMRDELRHALANTLEAENHNKELSRQIEQERVRSNQLKEVIDSLNEKLDSQSRTKQELEDELSARGKAVEEFETTNDRLRDDLEELFADMVSLSIVYESKESEVIAMNRNHHDELEAAHRDLRREKARSKDLQKMHDDLQESNEKLRRKLEKYKQRLQDEQRDREEKNVRRKRNGPVSYMNHLHQSTSLDRSRDRSTIKESGSNLPSTSRLRLEKENSYSYTLPRR